jgi:hypothetical protein
LIIHKKAIGSLKIINQFPVHLSRADLSALVFLGKRGKAKISFLQKVSHIGLPLQNAYFFQ